MNHDIYIYISDHFVMLGFQKDSLDTVGLGLVDM